MNKLKPQKQKHPWRALFALALVCSAAVIGWKVWPRPRLLLEHARYITTIPQGSWYTGSSPQSLLLIREPHKDQMELFRLDLATAKQTDLSRLNRLLNGSFVMHGQMEPSPDGQSMLWTDEDTGEIRAAHMDGSNSRRWPGDWHTQQFHWMEDSRRWITLDGAWPDESYKRIFIRSLESNQEQKTVLLPKESSLKASLGGDNILVVTTDGRLFVNETDQELDKISSLQIAEYTLLPKFSLLHRFTARPPQADYVNQLVLSPKGKRIAWIVSYNYASELSLRLHRILPSLSASVQPVRGIWISRLDGTDMSEVGHIRIPADTDEDWGPSHLKWLPDGKGLSFLYKDGFYTVPVD